MKVKRYLTRPVVSYLKELAAKTPVPGGGSAAAVSAALGVALNLMVINFSMKKDLSASARKALAAAKREQEKSLAVLTRLAEEDCVAFSALMKALSSGRGVKSAYLRAADVPLGICRECLPSLEITRGLLTRGNRNLITDVGCAARILRGAFHSARLNVMINLKYMGNASFSKKAGREIDILEKHIDRIEAEICSAMEKALQPRGKK